MHGFQVGDVKAIAHQRVGRLLSRDATEFNLSGIGANFCGKKKFPVNKVEKHAYRRDPSLLTVVNQLVFDQGGVGAMLRSHKNERPKGKG